MHACVVPSHRTCERLGDVASGSGLTTSSEMRAVASLPTAHGRRSGQSSSAAAAEVSIVSAMVKLNVVVIRLAR